MICRGMTVLLPISPASVRHGSYCLRRTSADTEGHALFVEAVVEELIRRAGQRSPGTSVLAIDAELWVDPEDWEEARAAILRAGTLLPERARRPHEPGTVHVNTSLVMFVMADPGSAAAAPP
jgi:hypothetical protein